MLLNLPKVEKSRFQPQGLFQPERSFYIHFKTQPPDVAAQLDELYQMLLANGN